MKILIAEDESVSRRKLEKILADFGHQITSVRNGLEALQAFDKDHYSMVITDWVMPEMNGEELVRRIRSRPVDHYVYVIMLTAKSGKKDLITGMNAGADDFIAKPFDKDELRVRLNAGERVIRLEENLFLKNSELKKVNGRMHLDLQAAAEIQQSLLPSKISHIDGINVRWRLRPCDELAGDILNFFQLDDEQLAFYVLDVSGHGVPAALLAVTLSRMLSPMLDDASLLKVRDTSRKGYQINSPAKVAEQLNKRFQLDMNSGQFFTLLYGIIDLKSRQLRYASAGHPGLVVVSQTEGTRILESPSLPIGFLENTQYSENVVELSAGDRIYVCSDGIPEAENVNGELYGFERMLETLGQTAGHRLDESLELLLQDVEAWRNSSTFSDDVTLLTIEIDKKP